jgi:hypothetical protein
MPLLGVALDGNGFQGEVCLVLGHILGQIGQIDEGIRRTKSESGFCMGRTPTTGILWANYISAPSKWKPYEKDLSGPWN